MEDDSTSDANNQLVSTLCMFETRVSFGNTSDSTRESFCVNCSSDLLDGAFFIVSNKTSWDENTPIYWQHSADLLKRTFDDVLAIKNNPEDFFRDLIKAYAQLYHIDLHLIVHDGNKYVMVDKSNFNEFNGQLYSSENHAFIWCTADAGVCWPLSELFKKDISCSHNSSPIGPFPGVVGRKDSNEEVCAWRCVESFIEQVNQELLNTTQNQIEESASAPEEDPSYMTIDAISSTANQSISSTTLSSEPWIPANAIIEQALLQVSQMAKHRMSILNNMFLGREVSDIMQNFNVSHFERLSPKDAGELIQQRLLLISEVIQRAFEEIPQGIDSIISTETITERNTDSIQSNQTNNFVQIDRNSVDVQPLVPTYMSNTTTVSNILSVMASPQLIHAAPEIIVQPKKDWHYRSMNDLGKHENPLLASEGPQRTRVQVKVPSGGPHTTHLGVKLLTIDEREHPSKVLVPKNTTVDMNTFAKDNNLDRLQFGQCNPMDHFDPENKYVYLSITLTERAAQEKDVLIHMFNLYQSSSITKEMIKLQHLDQCKLAFWFCILEDGIYKPVSPQSISNVIRES